MKKFVVALILLSGLMAQGQVEALLLKPRSGPPTNPLWTDGTLYRHTNGTIFHKVGGSWVSLGGSILLDATPTDGSTNAVESNGIFDALAGKVSLSGYQVITGQKDFQGIARFENSSTVFANGFQIGDDSVPEKMNFKVAGDGVIQIARTLGGSFLNIDINNLTGVKTLYAPDASGTIALTSNLSSYLPLDGSAPMTGDFNVGDNDISSVGNMTAQSAEITDLNATEATINDLYVEVDAEINANLRVTGDYGIELDATDVVPVSANEGNFYADDSENRMMYHDGTSFKKVLLEGDTSGGPTSWGSIPGTLSNQTDLQNALDGKLDKSGGAIVGNLEVQGILNMDNGSIDDVYRMIFSGYLDGAGELRLTPSNTIGGTAGKNSFNFKLGNVAYFRKVGGGGGLGIDFDGLTLNRTLVAPDKDGTMALTSDIPGDASELSVTTTNFDGILNSNDNTVQKALDAIDDAVGASDSGQGLHIVSKSGSETYDNSDITVSGGSTSKRIWNQHSTNDTITLGSGITVYGQPFLISAWGADSIYVKKGAGSTFYVPDFVSGLTEDGIVVKDRKPLTVIATANNEFYLVADYELHTEAVSAPVYEIADAANPVNEANAVHPSPSIEQHFNASVESTIVSDGSYSNKLTRTSGSNAGSFTFSLGDSFEIGESYTISVDTYVVSGTTSYIAFRARDTDGWSTGEWFFVQDLSDPGTDQWQTNSVTVTATATTGSLNFYTSGSTDNGAVVYYDNIVITKN